MGQGLSSVAMVLVGVIMARTLGKTEVAAYQQTFLAYRTVAPFLALGIGHGIYYFLPIEEDRKKGRIIDSILVLSVMGLTFSVFIALGGNQILARRFDNPEVAELLLWMIPYSLFMVPASHHTAVFVSQGRAGFSSISSTIIQFLITGFTILALLVWKNAESALVGNVIVSCLTAACSMILMIRLTPGKGYSPSARAIKEMVSYSLPLGFATMIATLLLSVDRILVSLMTSPEEFAVYSFGAREIPLIGIVFASLSSVVLVQIRKEVKAGNHQNTIAEFKNYAKITAPILFPVAVFCCVNSEGIIVILYTTEYSAAAIPFAIYSATVLVRIFPFGAILGGYGKNWFILTQASVGLLFNIGFSIVGIYYLGPSGAALATFLTLLIVMAPLSFWKIAKTSECRIRNLISFSSLSRQLLVAVAFSTLQLLILAAAPVLGLWINGVLLALLLFCLNKQHLTNIPIFRRKS